MRKSLLCIAALMFCSASFAQFGGKHVYEFLNLVSSPRVAALGGKYISYADDDLSLSYHNPSLLNNDMVNRLSLNAVSYYAGVKYGYVGYCNRFFKKNIMSVGLQYINYGTFTGADENGSIAGSFQASEYSFNIAVSQPVNEYLVLGADVRPIFSFYENNVSIGLSSDYGMTYANPGKLYTLAFVVRNLGTQLKPYTTGTYETLPVELQLGFTQQLRYAPFRFSVTAQHLETPDMSVSDLVDPNASQVSATASKRQVDKMADIVMRHLIFGVEFFPFKNFYLRGGYNYQRRQELKLTTSAGGTGFSWGFGLSVSRFQLNYGWATYRSSGGSNHFSIATDLSTFGKSTKK
ncbi:MAG: type IX secretion system protein PorQ [Bacteroidota bacterium]|nr:type IX secretion system protein PorQ [Bacteroidota bacterium]